jgi:outer membrane protease
LNPKSSFYSGLRRWARAVCLAPASRAPQLWAARRAAFFALALFAVTATARAAPIAIAFGLTTGVISGQAEEIVYRNPRYSDKLSQLLWDIDALPYAGFSLDAAAAPTAGPWTIHAHAAIKFAAPMKTGNMEDRDWKYTPGKLSEYSIHQNNTQSATLGAASAGVAWTITPAIALRAALAYKYIDYAFTATGGTYSYRAPSPPIETVVAYSQTWHILTPALSLIAHAGPRLAAEATLKITPLVWCTAVDKHLLTDATYTDAMTGLIYISPSAAVSYTPIPPITITATASYTSITGARGDTTTNKTSIPPTVDTAGASYHAFDVSLTASFNFK